jgi:hypothetical protein
MKNSISSRTFTIASLAVLAGVVASSSASAQITISATTTAFNDISATGTSPGTSSDDAEINISMAALSGAGFAGNELLPLANIRMGNNGSVIWNSTAGEVGYINSTMFGTMAASNLATTGNGGSTAGQSFLAVLWDDNTPASGQTANALDWQVVGGNLILQWSNEDHFNATGTGTVQYQAIIYGGATIASGAPLVDFVYNDTLYGANLYQNDGGSATIGYKNWGTIAAANDVQFGVGGGTDTLADPTFGGTNMQPKVGGHAASNDPTLPHAVRIAGTVTATPFCFGDGTGTACPCGNSGATGNGCAHSLSANGANLAASGAASIAADTFTLNGSNMPNSSALYFQGTTQVAAGAGAMFGDGKRCAGGTIVRLGTKTNVGGASSYPVGGDALIHIKGNVAAGNVRTYQVWYRNAAAFCTADTFNLTNGVQTTWGP